MDKKIVGNAVVFKFDGEADYVFDATRAERGMRDYAELHGWQARLGDNAAISRKQKDGTIITVTEKMRRDAVATLGDYYMGGATAWNSGRASAESAPIRALADSRGITYAEAEELVRKLATSGL